MFFCKWQQSCCFVRAPQRQQPHHREGSMRSPWELQHHQNQAVLHRILNAMGHNSEKKHQKNPSFYHWTVGVLLNRFKKLTPWEALKKCCVWKPHTESNRFDGVDRVSKNPKSPGRASHLLPSHWPSSLQILGPRKRGQNRTIMTGQPPNPHQGPKKNNAFTRLRPY